MYYEYLIQHGIKPSEILKDVSKIVPDENQTQVFLPKPFVFEGMMGGVSTKVYLPGQAYIPFIDGLPLESAPMYMCVHLCEQFSNYPVLGPGIRCIPKNAKCPFGGRCHGAHLMWHGKNTGKSIDMNNTYISRAALKTR